MQTLAVLNVASPFVAVGADAVGGAEQVVHHLDAALASRGHLSIVVARAGSRVAGTLVSTPPATLAGGNGDAAVWAAHRSAVVAVCTRQPIDLVHIHGVEFQCYLPPPGVPVLVSLHMPADRYPPEEIRSPRPGLWFNCVSASQRAAFAASPAMLDAVPNGIAVEAFAGRHARRGFALFLGRISPEKGVHLALDAARMADMPLLVAGEVFPGVEAQRYFDREIAPRLDGQRRFIGPLGLARKRRFLAAARCLLMPSLSAEAGSLVVMEAMAAGTPVIAFPAGELVNAIDHARTGWLVDSVAEMAAALARTHEIAPEACRSEARARFSHEAMTAKYLALYRRLSRCRG